MAAPYQLTHSTFVIRTADQAWIPDDPNNRDRQDYNDWIAVGNVPDPAPPIISPNLNSVGYGPTSDQAVGG
jgi:hypothetical protein